MRIGIEVRWIALSKTGFGNYTLNLIRELSRIDEKNQYYLYFNKEFQDDLTPQKKNFHKIIIKMYSGIYKHLCIPLDIVFNKRNLDLFHFAYNSPSIWFPCKFVLTIHDASFKYIPEMLSKKDLFSISTKLYISARKAEKVITDSENSKRDIVKFFKVLEEKIAVIYLGVDESFQIISNREILNDIRRKYNLPEKYLLYVGSYLPHKNLDTLIKAFCDLKRNTNTRHSLVLCGKKGRNFLNISKLIRELQLDDCVFCIGYVPADELPILYNMSDLFIFPSLYEGFGLPILEAMACGVPVIASNSSCLPEIAGEAALLFNPRDKNELAKAIYNLLTDAKAYNYFVEKGLKRAKQFTWRKMAEGILKIYEDICKMGEQAVLKT